jgi:TolB-like protein
VVEESDGDLMGDGVNIAARLEGIAKPGAICLSEDAYRQVKSRLDLAVTDLGPTQLKNIAEPIRVYSLEVGATAPAKPAPAPASKKSAAPRLSIVVLPFANIGGDLAHEHFVDGVTESLTTDLSRMRGAFVIGRNTAFTYKGKAVDLKQIGRELNVRYVLEGSVQRGGNRMRVNVQLIDAETGAHLWADQFDANQGEMLEMQDEIVTRLAHSLQIQLTAVEASRVSRAHPENADAEELAMQCEAGYLRWGVMPVIAQPAYALCERALELDNGNVRALALDPNNYLTHYARAFFLSYGRPDEAIAEAERAQALNPSFLTAYIALATANLSAGRATKAIDYAETALRLGPGDPLVYGFPADEGLRALRAFSLRRSGGSLPAVDRR